MKYLSPAANASPSPLETCIADLLAAGVPAASIDAAVNLMRTGAADLLLRVIERELSPECAWQIARQRVRQ
jgi:hypothetical protein